jgi:hypothetical protein
LIDLSTCRNIEQTPKLSMPRNFWRDWRSKGGGKERIGWTCEGLEEKPDAFSL